MIEDKKRIKQLEFWGNILVFVLLISGYILVNGVDIAATDSGFVLFGLMLLFSSAIWIILALKELKT